MRACTFLKTWSVLTLAMGAAACGESHGAGHGGAPTGSSTPPSSIPIASIETDAVYVVNGGDATISVIDPGAGAVVGTIQLQNVAYPHHVYLSPDRARLAIGVPGHDLSMGHGAGPEGQGEHGAGHGSAAPHGGAGTLAKGAVLVLDARTGATVASRTLEAPNHNAVYSKDGTEIWTALLSDPGAVLVLDAATLETKQTIAVGRVPAEVTFSPDGTRAFVANGTSDDVTVLDAATKAVLKTIPVGREPVGAWPGADGLMYVDCEKAKTLEVIDPNTLEIVRSYALGFTPGMAAVPATATEELWVSNADGGKVVFNTTRTTTPVAEVATAPGTHAFAFAPDGAAAFVTNQLDDSVSIVDMRTRTIRSTLKVGLKPNGIVFRSAR